MSANEPRPPHCVLWLPLTPLAPLGYLIHFAIENFRIIIFIINDKLFLFISSYYFSETGEEFPVNIVFSVAFSISALVGKSPFW